jgi:hypothetical protein
MRVRMSQASGSMTSVIGSAIAIQPAKVTSTENACSM